MDTKKRLFIFVFIFILLGFGLFARPSIDQAVANFAFTSTPTPIPPTPTDTPVPPTPTDTPVPPSPTSSSPTQPNPTTPPTGSQPVGDGTATPEGLPSTIPALGAGPGQSDLLIGGMLLLVSFGLVSLGWYKVWQVYRHGKRS